MLIVCTHFPPLNRTGARRPYYLAKEFRRQGAEVRVLCSDEPEDVSWDADLDGMEVMRCDRTELQDDLGPVQLMIALVLRRSKGTFLHGPMRVMADLVLPLDHASRWNVSLEQVFERLGKPDIVVATGPAWSAAQFGERIAKASRATFILDYRDPWSVADPKVHIGLIHEHGRGLANTLRKWMLCRHERRIGRSAFALTAVSDAFLRNAQRICGNPRGATFLGGFSPRSSIAQGVRNDKLTLVYTGRVYTEQDWRIVIQAIDILRQQIDELSSMLRIELIGAISNDQELIDRLEACARRTGVLHLIPRRSRQDALLDQERADALLHLAYRDRRGYLPVKFLEYLNAGRPILLISAENDLMEGIITETRTGHIIPDADSLARFLRDRLTDKASGKAWEVTPDRSALATYAYDARMRSWADRILAWHTEHRSATTTDHR